MMVLLLQEVHQLSDSHHFLYHLVTLQYTQLHLKIRELKSTFSLRRYLFSLKVQRLVPQNHYVRYFEVPAERLSVFQTVILHRLVQDVGRDAMCPQLPHQP